MLCYAVVHMLCHVVLCRREEELAKYHMTKQNQTVQLSLTSQFNYSSGGSSGSSDGGGSSGASTA